MTSTDQPLPDAAPASRVHGGTFVSFEGGDGVGKTTQLTRLRDQLTTCIGCGCLSLDTCALSNPHDELGALGPGPRRLLVDADDASS